MHSRHATQRLKDMGACCSCVQAAFEMRPGGNGILRADGVTRGVICRLPLKKKKNYRMQLIAAQDKIRILRQDTTLQICDFKVAAACVMESGMFCRAAYVAQKLFSPFEAMPVVIAVPSMTRASPADVRYHRPADRPAT